MSRKYYFLKNTLKRNWAQSLTQEVKDYLISLGDIEFNRHFIQVVKILNKEHICTKAELESIVKEVSSVCDIYNNKDVEFIWAYFGEKYHNPRRWGVKYSNKSIEVRKNIDITQIARYKVLFDYIYNTRFASHYYSQLMSIIICCMANSIEIDTDNWLKNLQKITIREEERVYKNTFGQDITYTNKYYSHKSLLWIMIQEFEYEKDIITIFKSDTGKYILNNTFSMQEKGAIRNPQKEVVEPIIRLVTNNKPEDLSFTDDGDLLIYRKTDIHKLYKDSWKHFLDSVEAGKYNSNICRSKVERHYNYEYTVFQYSKAFKLEDSLKSFDEYIDLPKHNMLNVTISRSADWERFKFHVLLQRGVSYHPNTGKLYGIKNVSYNEYTFLSYGDENIYVKNNSKHFRPATLKDLINITFMQDEISILLDAWFELMATRYPLYKEIQKLYHDFFKKEHEMDEKIDLFQEDEYYDEYIDRYELNEGDPYFPIQLSAGYRYKDWHEYFTSSYKNAAALEFDYNSMDPKVSYTLIKLSKYIVPEDLSIFKEALEKWPKLLNYYGFRTRFNKRCNGEIFAAYYANIFNLQYQDVLNEDEGNDDFNPDFINDSSPQSVRLLNGYFESMINNKEQISLRKNSIQELLFEGSDINVVPIDKNEVDLIKKLLADKSDMFSRAWKVTNANTEKKFEKYCKTNSLDKPDDISHLFHGTDSANWISIIKSGLLIRESRHGNTFGRGIYFAPYAGKSLHYTDGSMYSNSTRNNKTYLAIFKVATGKPFYVYSEKGGKPRDWNDFHEKHPDRHCCWAEDNQTTSEDKSLRPLTWDEVIVYKEDQCTIEYLVELNLENH